MVVRPMLAAGVVCCALCFVRPASGLEAVQQSGSVLKDISALDKRVTYSETKIPLDELVAKVAADTGVPLGAARDVADEPVAVIVNEYPARELLDQIAELLDYRWARRGKEGAWRYEIYQDLASKQQEAALRRGVLADMEVRFRREIARSAEMAALPQEQFQRILDAEERYQRELGKLSRDRRRALRDTPEAREHEQRLDLARRLWSPIQRATMRMVGRLSSGQWTWLREGGDLTFSTDPQPGELSLSPDVVTVFRSSRPSLAPWWEAGRASSDPRIAEALRQREREAEEASAVWVAATGYRVTIGMPPNDWFPSSLGIEAHAGPLRSGAPSQPPRYESVSFFSVGVTGSLAQTFDEENTSQRRAALASDPVLGRNEVIAPAPPRRADGSTSSLLRRDPLLPLLAQKYGVQFLADAYYATLSDYGYSFPREPTALFTLLDVFWGGSHRYERRANLVRMRSRTWFFDRPREVPLRFVRQWQHLFQTRAALPLESYADMASALSDAQLGSLAFITHYETGLSSELPEGAEARHALRLYAALTPVQRQALSQGATIPAARMTPQQRDLFLAGMEKGRRTRSSPLEPAQAAGGGFRLTQTHLTRVHERRGGVTYERTEEVPPAAVAGSARAPRPANAAPAVSRGTAAVPTVRYPLSRLEFQYRLGAASPVSVSITVSAPR